MYLGRREDPEVRMKFKSMTTFSIKVLEGFRPKNIRGINRIRLIYEVLSSETLGYYIGTKWNERIMNENGDFAHVVPGTLRFWLTKRNSLVEFKLIGDKYVRSEIKDGHKVVFYICPWRWQQIWIQKYGPSLIYLI